MTSPTSPTSPIAASDRRLDLDWLRIIAFGLLILYHTGMFYVSWDFHVKSSRAGPAIEPLMLLTNLPAGAAAAAAVAGDVRDRAAAKLVRNC
jgi:hypothetical protein